MRIFKKKFSCMNQLDAMDCGPACLQSIALYYGKKVDLSYIREISFLTREGVSLLAISKAAEKLGFRTRGVKVGLDSLFKNATLPCILHWRQEHFVVLYEVKTQKGKRIYRIADPSVGKIDLDEDSFKYAWIYDNNSKEDTGICLLLEPSSSFSKSDERLKKLDFSFIFPYLNPFKKYYFHLLLGLVLGAIIQIAFPFLTQSIVDKGIGNHDVNIIYLILVGFLLFTLTNSVITYIRNILLLNISARINISIVSDFLCKLLSLPIGYFDKKFSGDIIQRIKDHDRIESLLVKDLIEIIFNSITLTVFGSILCYYNIQIFIIFIIGSTLYITWISFFLKKRKIVDYKRFIVSSQNQSSIFQIINGIQDIKLYNCEIEKRWEWEKIQVNLFKINLSGLKLEQIQYIGAGIINEFKNILIIFYSAFLVLNGDISVGSMMAIQYINGQLNGPISGLIKFILSIQDAKIALERLGEVHLESDELSEGAHLQICDRIESKDIRIQNLTFRYNDPYSRPVIDNVSFTIPNGKTTAIVGISGTGKTTLIKLILGFYLPESGKITIGSCNLNDINPYHWRKHCGVVMQDGYIFSDTIAKNICLIEDEIDEYRLIEVCELAQLTEYIESLPLKFNTKIGDDGMGLSQGQKQRILIARALYHNPDFIFLDEATNSLDTKNEAAIVTGLSNKLKGKTKIVIAHRLSTIRNADQIVVMDNGKIIEIGTHESLIHQMGAYYELINRQL